MHLGPRGKSLTNFVHYFLQFLFVIAFFKSRLYNPFGNRFEFVGSSLQDDSSGHIFLNFVIARTCKIVSIHQHLFRPSFRLVSNGEFSDWLYVVRKHKQLYN